MKSMGTERMIFIFVLSAIVVYVGKFPPLFKLFLTTIIYGNFIERNFKWIRYSFDLFLKMQCCFLFLFILSLFSCFLRMPTTTSFVPSFTMESISLLHLILASRWNIFVIFFFAVVISSCVWCMCKFSIHNNSYCWVESCIDSRDFCSGRWIPYSLNHHTKDKREQPMIYPLDCYLHSAKCSTHDGPVYCNGAQCLP